MTERAKSEEDLSCCGHNLDWRVVNYVFLVCNGESEFAS